MNEKTDQSTNRRHLLKYVGLGIFGGWIGRILSTRNTYASGSRLSHAMWIHGHSMQIEHTSNIINTWRPAFFIQVEGKSNTSNWFHFAIPTPVIVDGNRLRIDSAMLVLKTTSSDAIVQEVHIFDGNMKISSHKNINLSGNIGFRRFSIAKKPKVNWGIGISIGVKFGSKQGQQMEFISAGCDFIS